MFKTRNGRNMVDPGNGIGLYQGGRMSKRGSSVPAVATSTYSPRKEKSGRALAKLSLALAYAVHCVVIPISGFSALLLEHYSISSNIGVVGIGFAFFAGLFIIVARVVANGLTSKDDEMSYRAVKVYFIGVICYFLFILVAGIVFHLLS